MPVLTLKDLWLHEAADPSIYLTFDGGAEVVAITVPGDVRVMANGRVVVVTSAGDREQFEVTCPYVTQIKFDTLEAWVRGRTLLMLRDAKRRVRWGRILGLNGDVTRATEETVSFTFNVITYDETV